MNNSQFFIVFTTLCAIIFLEKKMPYIGKIHVASFLHCCITAITAHYVLINDPWKFLTIYEYNMEDFPLIAQIVPYISYAFGFYDLYYGITLRKVDFIIHGTVFTTSALITDYYNAMHYSYMGLLLETSTPFFHLLHYKIPFIETAFAFTFLLYRCVFFPIMTIIYFFRTYNNIVNNEMNLEKGVIICACTLNALNIYWGSKIVKRAIRKYYPAKED
jgi:hypothetical protein